MATARRTADTPKKAPASAKAGTKESRTVYISAPNIKLTRVTITGTAPYVQNRFAAMKEMMEAQRAGGTAKSRKVRKPKDFERLYEMAQHRAVEGWHGIPAAGFRTAMIDACRLVGYHMTKAKMAVFVLGHGLDEDGNALVKISSKPQMITSRVRLKDGSPDIRARPMWKKWSATLDIKYDADQFTETDVINLLSRAGTQIGIGEGRPFSKGSAGMGWGTFEVAK